LFAVGEEEKNVSSDQDADGRENETRKDVIASRHTMQAACRLELALAEKSMVLHQ
jgi:hypothetical protein